MHQQNKYSSQNNNPEVIRQQQQNQINLYQSKVQQFQISKIQEQYQAENAQKISQLNHIKQKQLSELAQNFMVNQSLSSDVIGGADRDEFVVEINKQIVRLVIFYTFPEVKPRIYLLNKQSHKFVDTNTWEIIYSTFYPWNQQSSNLKNLFTKIKEIFQNDPPKNDPISQEMDNIKNICCEDQQYQSLLQCDLGRIFKGLGPDDWRRMSSNNYHNFDEYLIKTDEYKNLVDFVLQLMQANQVYSQTMIDQYQEILQKRENIYQLAQYCDIKKGELLKTFQNCQSIKERFQKTNILSFLEQQIHSLEDEEAEQEQQYNIQEYFQRRKKLHKFKILKQKLESDM
ncbi:hypothetical protein PPERSA_04502 [Pseudocohnilembus persalinus]|uniref:Uncharacterized protein n=1 Tax=Pseudocohnilembus persalinus TaxID=266149 RepID=A0A0V0QSX4_PSEPJ|nr:hypothetical protein PPERSA_04502 [Pseudocohnilembus persalinus]|eukprot:KRX05465.1 hypothetical protein PPERSA_04502 [Pseudocohnilembus persalinus]